MELLKNTNHDKYRFTIGHRTYGFSDLKDLMAKASPLKSGDCLAGCAADSEEQRIAARFALADLPLGVFLNETLIPYATDEVTRLILDTHDAGAFLPVSSLTVGKVDPMSRPIFPFFKLHLKFKLPVKTPHPFV